MLRPIRTPCKSYTGPQVAKQEMQARLSWNPHLFQGAVAVVAFLSKFPSDPVDAMLVPFLPSIYVVGISSRRGNAAKKTHPVPVFGLLTPRDQSFKSMDACQGRSRRRVPGHTYAGVAQVAAERGRGR